MLVISPTELRRDLFKSLQRVLLGETLQVKTKEGTVILVAEKRHRVSADALRPKIPFGKIDLEGADEALRAYIRFPGNKAYVKRYPKKRAAKKV